MQEKTYNKLPSPYVFLVSSQQLNQDDDFNLLFSSRRIRGFIEQQLHLLHVSPDEALTIEQMKIFCNKIKHNYCDFRFIVSLFICFQILHIFDFLIFLIF